MKKEYFIKIFGEELANAKTIQCNSSYSQRNKSEEFLKCFTKNLYKTMNKESFTKYKLFVLPFCVEADDKEKTSHFIVFITKSHNAIQEMKKVMLNYSNSDGEKLIFDSKDKFQISLFCRQDNLTKTIIEKIIEAMTEKESRIDDTYTIESLMEMLDKVSMFKFFQVFPYSKLEIKQAIEELDNKQCISVDLKPGAKKRITNDRQFKITKRIMEI